MNRAPLDAAFGLTLMVAGAMIALPEKLKAKSPLESTASASVMPASQEQRRRCEEAKLATIVALQQSDASGYRQWEQRSRLTCQAAGF